jgi:hypothetical protein
MKNELGLQYYGRYVDDFVVVGCDKEHLKKVIRLSGVFLEKNLHLQLHPLKIYLQHYSKGVKFLGAIIKPGRLLVARRTKKNFVDCLREWDKFLAENEPAKEDLLFFQLKFVFCINNHYICIVLSGKFAVCSRNYLKFMCGFKKYIKYCLYNLYFYILCIIF